MAIAKVNGIDIWYETFGSRESEPLLLIMGACCQGILWPTEFCQKLSAAGFFVIRYDHRDTGFSTYFDYEKSPYNLNDLMQDAISLLDYLKVRKFHAVGLSMGGPIAELLSIHYAERTCSITLMATSSDFRPMNLAYAGLSAEESSLSQPLKIYLEWMSEFVSSPPKNQAEHVEFLVKGWRILSGNKVPFEEERHYELQKEFLDRARGSTNYLNHGHVFRLSEETIKAVPSQVKVPTLILHGSEDPIFPPDHGDALAAAICHSQFVLIEGMGHVPNCHFYDSIIQNVKRISNFHTI